jgi:2-polyprenyl-3-methyl-5-hydroxy-6-metoxy-1,4-benzoquinol methylase
MEPHAFVKEVYRRMSLRHATEAPQHSWEEIQSQTQVQQAIYELRPLLPPDKNSPILDIGFGRGWFLAACLSLGYTNLSGAEFGIANKEYVRAWRPHSIQLFEIEDNIGAFLSEHGQRFEFIHMSHVIEHVPKYSLLWVVDALYFALNPNGTLMLRTPNMEAPCANSSYFVTLAHEYGFSASNLHSLLDICGSMRSDCTAHRRFSPLSNNGAVWHCGGSF